LSLLVSCFNAIASLRWSRFGDMCDVTALLGTFSARRHHCSELSHIDTGIYAGVSMSHAGHNALAVAKGRFDVFAL